MLYNLIKAGAVFALFCFYASAQATVLDWSSVTWTPGSLTNSYDIDPSRAGTDVTVTISGDTTQLQPELVAPNPATPAITTDFQGGLPAPVSTLGIALNLANQSQSVTLAINFSAAYAQGVTNVSFQLFDIDFSSASGNNYQDQLSNIRALSADGVTLIAPTITTSSSNTFTGSGLNQVVNGVSSVVDTGAGSGNGNVTISFGSNAITSFTFTYGSGSGTAADPTYQHIGIYNLDFTAVPEINPALSASLICLLAIGLTIRPRRKVATAAVEDR
jgi:hypothetical protein